MPKQIRKQVIIIQAPLAHVSFVTFVVQQNQIYLFPGISLLNEFDVKWKNTLNFQHGTFRIINMPRQTFVLFLIFWF